MHTAQINNKTLKTLCWRKGMSVGQLARKIKRARPSIYRAIRFPEQHRPTYTRIVEALNE